MIEQRLQAFIVFQLGNIFLIKKIILIENVFKTSLLNSLPVRKPKR